MNISSLIASVNAPSGLWQNLINWIQGSVGNLGWTILLLTLFVKVVTSPLDFLVKFTTKQQTLIQQKCAPQVSKLKKKFGNDRQRLQIQTNAIYKKEGLKMGVGCIVQLVNLILTCVIFFSFFSALRTTSAYNAIHQYEIINQTFDDASVESIKTSTGLSTQTEVETYVSEYETAYNYVNNPNNSAESDEYKQHNELVKAREAIINKAYDDAVKASQNKWHETKSSWLWVENIWVADATTSVFPDYDSLKSMSKNAGEYYKDYFENNVVETEYTFVTSIIRQDSRKYNGYYILAVLAGLITFASQYISELHTKLKNKNANKLAKSTNDAAGASTLKIMKIIMPIMMIMFVLTSTASFGIYILASNLASIIMGELIALIVNALTKKKRLEVEAELEKEANRLIKKGKLQE